MCVVFAKQGSNFTVHMDIQLSQNHFLKKMILSPFNCLGTLVKSEMTIRVRIISRLLNLLHWCICVSLCTLFFLLVLDIPDIHIHLTLLRLIISKQNNGFNKSQAPDIEPRKTQNPVVILATADEPDQKDFCLWLKT